MAQNHHALSRRKNTAKSKILFQIEYILYIWQAFGHWPHPIFVSCVRCAAAVLARREALYRRHRP